MSNHLVLSCLLLCILVVFSCCQKYSARYDSINIDSILSNERILRNYLKCVLDKGPCTNEGRDLKKDIPRVFATACGDCSKGQKKLIRKGVKFLIDTRPADWDAVVEHYDPDKKSIGKFLEFINEV